MAAKPIAGNEPFRSVKPKSWTSLVIVSGLISAIIGNFCLSNTELKRISIFLHPVNNSMRAATAFGEDVNVPSIQNMHEITNDGADNSTAKLTGSNTGAVGDINANNPALDTSKMIDEEESESSEVQEPWKNSRRGPSNATTMTPTAVKKIGIFYNIYASKGNPEIARKVVEEQINKIGNSTLAGPQLNTTIYYLTLGHPFTDGFIEALCASNKLGCQHLRHQNSGGELDTLVFLYDYCQLNPNERVMYIHSKGMICNS